MRATIAARSSFGFCGSFAISARLIGPLPRPEECVSRSRTVMARVAGTSVYFGGAAPGVEPGSGTATFISLNSGMNRETGSVSRTLPSSTIIRTATAVTTFDMEASRNTESFIMGLWPSTSMRPCASK